MSGTVSSSSSPATPSPAPAQPAAGAHAAQQGNTYDFIVAPGSTVDILNLPTTDLGDTIEFLTPAVGSLELVPIVSQTGAGSGLVTGVELEYVASSASDAPSSLVPGIVDAFSYELVNPTTGNVDSIGTIGATIDVAPTASTLTAVFSAGQTLDLSQLVNALASPGLPADVLTAVSFTATHPEIGTGLAPINATFETGSTTPGGSDLVFTAPTSGSGVLTYTVEDQAGLTATGTIDFTVDPGPTVTAQGTYVIGHGQSANIINYVESLVSPGMPGDTVQITGASDNRGNATFFEGKGDPEITFTGNLSTGAGAGVVDELTYTAVDTFTSLTATQGGNSTVVGGESAPVTGTVILEVDPGPTAGTVDAGYHLGTPVDLTSAILGAVTPGLPGDTLSITAVGTAGTTGTVSLANGDVTCTGTSYTDTFTYTVSDQYGDTAVGTVDLGALAMPAQPPQPAQPAQPTVITGGPYGDSIIQGVAGPEQITAYGWGNTIEANGGSGTINAGEGNATVNLGSGSFDVTLAGYGNAVTGGDGNDTLSGSLGNTTVTLGNGNDSVNLGGYDNAIAIGSGTDTVVAGAGSDTVTGGGGTDTVTLAGYSNQVTLDGSNTTLINGMGSDTISLTGGTANLTLFGDSNMVFLNGTAGTINDQGQGLQVSIGAAPTGTDVIQNAASDPALMIDLTAGVGGYASVNAVLAALTSDGSGGTMLGLGAGGTLDLAGLTPSHLTAANFHVS
jgi:hypothetical protein